MVLKQEKNNEQNEMTNCNKRKTRKRKQNEGKLERKKEDERE